MFMDHQGEAVQIVSNGISPYDLQVIGAYEGIFLSRVQAITDATGTGAMRQFKIECEQVSLLCAVLDDGYYIVFVTERGAHEGLAWRLIEECRARLVQEM